MKKNTNTELSSEEEPKSSEPVNEPASNPIPEPVNSNQDLKQINEALQTLQRALDLKDRGGMAEEDYQEIKKKLLTQSGIKLPPTVAKTSSAKTASIVTPVQAIKQAEISLYAGELHELIVKQIEENFQIANGQNREYMESLVAKLVELGALYPQDKQYLNNLINVVCIQPETLENGLRQIDEITEEVRKNTSTSEAAKALTGIVYSSAKRARKLFELEKIKQQPTAKNKLWNAVEDDFLGGLTGATASASIVAMPGFSLAALGFAAGLSNPITWIPAAGVLIGASITSGWKYAKLRYGQDAT